MVHVLEPKCETVAMPLGLAYVAAYLQETTDYKIEILDCHIEGIDTVKREGSVKIVGLSEEEIKDRIRRLHPDIVGVSAHGTPSTRVHHRITRIVKEIDPEIKVIFGGVHASIEWKRVLHDKNVDAVVIGEGEISFAEVCKAVERGRSFDGIRGVAWRSGEHIVLNQPRSLIKDLDSLPLPARHLLNVTKYLEGQRREMENNYNVRYPALSMISSRGCPFRCAFCSFHIIYGQRFRPRSASKVVDEMEILIEKYGAREIQFMDDNITVQKKRVHQICDEILARKLEVRWCAPSGIDIRTLDEDLLKKMKKSGCYRLLFGIETGDPETRKYIEKHHNIAQAKCVVRSANHLGFWTAASYMIGFPYEKLDNIKNTFDLAKSLGTDFAVFNIATPYPKTKLYDTCIRESLIDANFWRKNYMSPATGGLPTLYLSASEVKNLIAIGYSQFIRAKLKPTAVLSIVQKIRSSEDLKYALKMIRKVSTMLMNELLYSQRISGFSLFKKG